MKNMEMISATALMSPRETKTKPMAQVTMDAMTGSLSDLRPRLSRRPIALGKIRSTASACRVRGAMITLPNALETAAAARPIGIKGGQMAMASMYSSSDASCSGLALTQNLRATKMYTMMPATVAHRVPRGMAVAGSFRSPLRPRPAAMPVKAGKMNVKTSMNVYRSMTRPSAVVKLASMVFKMSSSACGSPVPKKKLMSARTSTATTP